MPSVPIWYSRIDSAIQQIESLPLPWIDCASVAFALGVGRRRAQQIMRPLVAQTIGSSGIALKEKVISHLRSLENGTPATFEVNRRARLHSILNELQQERKARPRVLVEAPTRIVNQEFEGLPAGLHLSPGRIVIDGFVTPDEAKQKLLALIMAMGNDPAGFDDRISLEGKP